jgi:hypothetical protein
LEKEQFSIGRQEKLKGESVETVEIVKSVEAVAVVIR